LAVNGIIYRISKAEKSAITPPSLFGMERRIAYIHRKYHSGLIWIGVTSGLAGRKFSGSVRRFGMYRTIIMNRVRAIE